MMTVSEPGPLVTPHHCPRSASFKPIGPQPGDTGRCKQTAMVSIEFVPQLAAVSVLSKTLKRHTQSARMLDVFAARSLFLYTAPLSLVPSAVVLADLGWSPLSTLQTSGHHPASTSKHLNKDFEEMLLSGASRAIYYLFTTYLKKKTIYFNENTIFTVHFAKLVVKCSDPHQVRNRNGTK